MEEVGEEVDGDDLRVELAGEHEGGGASAAADVSDPEIGRLGEA